MKNNYKHKLFVSLVLSSMLLNEVWALSGNALPNGGKFVAGSSGNISSCKGSGTCMSISGNKPNSVIAWSGGFNIGKDAQVHFKGNAYNYLNLDYSKNPSILAGKLDGGNNNIFIVNPSGVIVTENGKVNANRFVASSNSISESLNKFKEQGANFSPVFKENKGNVVNMGTIQAKEVLMVGNSVISKGKVQGINGDKATKVHFVGNTAEIFATDIHTNNLKAEVKTSGKFHSSLEHYLAVKTSFIGDFYKIGIIGNIREWDTFANIYNNTNKLDSFQEFALKSNLDFKNNSISLITKEFKNKVFDGGGYALQNVKIEGLKAENFGIFTSVSNSTFKNLNLENISLNNINGTNIGALVGMADSSKFNNINLKNITLKTSGEYLGALAGVLNSSQVDNVGINTLTIYNSNLREESFVKAIGGLAGSINGGSYTNLFLERIALQNTGLKDVYSGGFAGLIGGGEFENIFLADLNISSKATYKNSKYAASGGFVGYLMPFSKVEFYQISLRNLENIYSSSYASAYSGGFLGYLMDDFNINKGVEFENIILQDIKNIQAEGVKHIHASGFATRLNEVDLKNIYLYFNQDAKIIADNNRGKFLSTSNVDINAENIFVFYQENSLGNVSADDKVFSDYKFNTQINKSEKDFASFVVADLQAKGVNIYQEDSGNLIFLQANSSIIGRLPSLDNPLLIGDVKLDKNDFDSGILSEILGSLSFDIINGDKDSIMQTIWFMNGFINGGNDALANYTLADNNKFEFFKDVENLKNIFLALKRVEDLKKNGLIDVNMLNKYRTLYAEYQKNLTAYDATIQDTYMQSLKKALENQYAQLSSMFLQVTQAKNLIQDAIGDVFNTDINYAIFKNKSIRFELGLVANFDSFEEKSGDDNLKFTGIPNSDLLDKIKKEPVFISPYQEEKDVYDEEKNRYTEKACFVSENPKTNNPCIVQMVTSN